jgi:hypothetical protein
VPSRSATRRNRYRRASPLEEAAARKKPAVEVPWARQHPTLVAIQDRLQLVLDAWNLLRAPDGSCRPKPYLPQGIKEPDAVYDSRIQHAQPTGFFRDALRTYAGMLSFLHWQALPDSLKRVVGNVDGMGTDLAVLLFIADLLVLRDGGCLLLVLPPATVHESEGHRLAAIDCGDRASLPRLALVPRADLLDWHLASVSRALLEFSFRRDQRRSIQPAPTVGDWIYTTFTLDADGCRISSCRAEPCATHPSGYGPVAAGAPQELTGYRRLPAVWSANDAG